MRGKKNVEYLPWQIPEDVYAMHAREPRTQMDVNETIINWVRNEYIEKNVSVNHIAEYLRIQKYVINNMFTQADFERHAELYPPAKTEGEHMLSELDERELVRRFQSGEYAYQDVYRSMHIGRDKCSAVLHQYMSHDEIKIGMERIKNRKCVVPKEKATADPNYILCGDCKKWEKTDKYDNRYDIPIRLGVCECMGKITHRVDFCKCGKAVERTGVKY